MGGREFARLLRLGLAEGDHGRAGVRRMLRTGLPAYWIQQGR
jgi:hypothetical protein